MFLDTEQRPQGEVPVTNLTPQTVTKLSQAIREGSKITCPLKHNFMIKGREGVYACALGAAAFYISGFVTGPNYNYNQLRRRFQVSEQTLNTVVHQNDQGLLTREEIADWLEERGL